MGKCPQAIVTSDNGNKGNSKGSDNACGNDNNHHSNMDMGSNKGMDIGICSNRGTGNNMVQDRIAY